MIHPFIIFLLAFRALQNGSPNVEFERSPCGNNGTQSSKCEAVNAK